MSIIGTPDGEPRRLDEPELFYVKRIDVDYPEVYEILNPFDRVKIELSLTVRGRRPTPEALVDFLILQGFIRPYRVN